ncbi:MAG: hypothetical protein GWO20_16320 [Candidatus Korarchaeota archaeon]|nr:hypothetical protein [Candidatus Korarchaeota archaeon]NIU84976.1 hypothetical protein [Candidatus Thorarchaeota archaeon]NIW14999.1 hypothetical protein [Candidatus Thorarchaeota archaeon]NIW53009.1 hypothetical protein [Candidatus Korarchaeota archaeon]
MQEKTKKIKVAGSSVISDCNCEQFQASGSSRIEGNLQADEARVSGSTKVTGNAHLGELSASGSFKVEGDTEAKNVEVSGSAEFMSKINADEMTISGSSQIGGDFTGKTLRVSGALKAAENVTTDTFVSKGVFKIGGTLKGDKIKAKLKGKSSAKDIEGGDITIESEGTGRFSYGKQGSLKAERIVGEDIHLENTEAELVEGDKVVVGPGCKITKVRAKEMDVDESATVKEQETLE